MNKISDVVRYIYDNEQTKIAEHYRYQVARLEEFQLAATLYSIDKNPASLQSCLQVWLACAEHLSQEKNEESKADFDVLTWRYFSHLLSSYKHDIKEKYTKTLQYLSEHDTFDKEEVLSNIQKICPIIDSLTVEIEQKKFVEEKPLISSEIRICDVVHLKNLDLKKIDQDLCLITCIYAKNYRLSSKYLENIFSRAKSIRNDFVMRHKEPDTICPLLYCLHEDIVAVLANPVNLYGKHHKDYHTENLWDDVLKYVGDTVKVANLKTICLPQSLSTSSIHKQVKEAIYVVLEDDTIVFGQGEILPPAERKLTNRSVHHIDIANGKNVKAAGIILFSQDMKEVVAINPSSGHYRPKVETCKAAYDAVKNLGFSVNDTCICDYNWKPLTQEYQKECQSDTKNGKAVIYGKIQPIEDKKKVNNNISLLRSAIVHHAVNNARCAV